MKDGPLVLKGSLILLTPTGARLKEKESFPFAGAVKAMTCPFVTECTENVDTKVNKHHMEDNNLKFAPVVSIPGNGPVIIRGYFSFKDSSGKVTEKEQEIHICGVDSRPTSHIATIPTVIVKSVK
jgi:hypothetical protein